MQKSLKEWKGANPKVKANGFRGNFGNPAQLWRWWWLQVSTPSFLLSVLLRSLLLLLRSLLPILGVLAWQGLSSSLLSLDVRISTSSKRSFFLWGFWSDFSRVTVQKFGSLLHPWRSLFIAFLYEVQSFLSFMSCQIGGRIIPLGSRIFSELVVLQIDVVPQMAG